MTAAALPKDDDLPPDGAKVFLSYSRKDRERAQGIAEALRARNFGVFRDTDDILPTEEWRERLQQLIEEADTIVFLLSPHSAASEICAWEVDYATQLNKRIAPIVIDDVEGDRIPPRLARLNFIFCTPRDPFENAVDTLISALNNDIGWIREHTRLLGLAKRWRDAGTPDRLLLRGQDIADAEAWRDTRPKDAPDVTQHHARFITESRRVAGRRQRNWIIGSLAVTAGAVALAVFAWAQSVEADRQRGVADANARAEALSRFRSESRLADAIAGRGDGTAWRVLTTAARDYADFAGRDAAFAALDGDVLRIALSALLKERVLATELPPDPAARLLGFFDDGRRVAVHSDGAVQVIDARTGGVSATYQDVGEPLAFQPGGGTNFAVIACREPPCLSSRDDVGDFVGEFARALFGSGSDASDDRVNEVWGILDDPARAADADMTLGKLGAVFLDAADPAPHRTDIARCGVAICIGDANAAIAGEIGAGFVQADIRAAGADARLRLADGMFPAFAPDRAPVAAAPVGSFDPAEPTIDALALGPDVVVRTSFLSARVEIFRRGGDAQWSMSEICLDRDEELDDCAGGLVGVRILDGSARSGLILVTSYNQGTGGGNGAHHTSLVDVTTGAVVWRADRVSSAGAFSPDGSRYALIDWLGALEVRDARRHDRIYEHPARVSMEADAIAYAPRGDLAAALASDGGLFLLDLTGTDDLAMTRDPLRSQRGACRETDDGPFRAIARPDPRPFSTVDWDWIAPGSGVMEPLDILLPDPEARAPGRITASIGDGDILVPGPGGADLRIGRTVLESTGHVLDETTPVFANVAENGSSVVLWGAEASGNAEGSVWFWLTGAEGDWRMIRSGRVDGLIEGPAAAVFVTDGDLLAFHDGVCGVRVMSRDGQGPEFRVTPAFDNVIALEIDADAGVLRVVSLEWYGDPAVQLFDLRTGASGPWLNVQEDGYPDGHVMGRPLQLRAPPWGDVLRGMILAAE